jgi:membrane associated rhomboid family serine protease
MIIPWSTDAPIYHRPWATIGLMVATVAVFFLTAGLEEETIEPYLLSHGEGLHPVQWVTSNFLHDGIMHLVGNLIFLWAFALIVEGKIGFFPFLAVFLGLGIVQSGLEQLFLLGMPEGNSLGNSAIIYGLMAMALVWAPRNEVGCVWWFGFRAGLIDISVLWFAILYIALEVVRVVFWHGVVGLPEAAASAVLHLSGAALGFGLGVLMLKRGWVDCENWDLFAVVGHREGRPEGRRVPRVKAPKADKKAKARMRADSGGTSSTSPEDRAASATRRFQAHLESGSTSEAYASYDKSVRAVPGWMPADPDWLALIQALLTAGDISAAVSVMEDYLRRSPKPSARVRLRLAQVLVKDQQRPAHALKILDAIPDGALPENLGATARQLRREAERMREEGVLELEGGAW